MGFMIRCLLATVFIMFFLATYRTMLVVILLGMAIAIPLLLVNVIFFNEER
jgi:hypothetical protein